MLNRSAWDEMHKNDYHPKVAGIVHRISKDFTDKSNPYGHLFEEWSGILNTSIDVTGKTVLEIGHGGGWYLAQCLRDGAKHAIGIEVSEEINDRVKAAFAHFGLENFKLYLADESCLEKVTDKVDLIYTITVFQHTDQSITEKYLSTAKCILNAHGVMYAQFYMTGSGTTKNPPEFVSYSEEEVALMLSKCGLQIESHGGFKLCNSTDWWGIYCLKPSGN